MEENRTSIIPSEEVKNDNVNEQKNSDIDIIKMSRDKAMKDYANGKKASEIAEDFVEAESISHILKDEEKIKNFSNIKSSEYESKYRSKEEQAKAEQIRTAKERQREIYEAQEQDRYALYNKYKWCMNKVALEEPVPSLVAIIGLGMFLIYYLVYQMTIGAILGIGSIALEQAGKLIESVAKFINSAGDLARSSVKIIIFGTLFFIVVGFIVLILFILYNIKNIGL